MNFGNSCLVCGTFDVRPFADIDGYNIVTCTNCGFRYVSPLPSDEVLFNFYNSIHYHSGSRYGQQSRYNPWGPRIMLINRYRKGATLLDIGCATGHFIAEAMRCGYDCQGIDLSAEAIEQARSLVGVDRVQQKDVFDLTSDTIYNVVTIWALIEHVKDPAAYFTKINSLLEVDGLLALSTPNCRSLSARFRGSKWKYYIPPEHLFYFDMTTISKLLKKCGFRVVYHNTRNNPPAWISKNRSIPNWYYSLFLRIIFKIFIFPILLFSSMFKKGETLEVYAVKEKHTELK